MTKSELKTGMIVTLRNGARYLVVKDIASVYTANDDLKNCIICLTSDIWNGLEYYTEDLYYYKGNPYNRDDIMKVSQVYHPYDLRKIFVKDAKFDEKVLWEREEVKEVTMAEIEEKFGCKVKIVKED